MKESIAIELSDSYDSNAVEVSGVSIGKGSERDLCGASSKPKSILSKITSLHKRQFLEDEECRLECNPADHQTKTSGKYIKQEARSKDFLSRPEEPNTIAQKKSQASVSHYEDNLPQYTEEIVRIAQRPPEIQEAKRAKPFPRICIEDKEPKSAETGGNLLLKQAAHPKSHRLDSGSIRPRHTSVGNYLQASTLDRNSILTNSVTELPLGSPAPDQGTASNRKWSMPLRDSGPNDFRSRGYSYAQESVVLPQQSEEAEFPIGASGYQEVPNKKPAVEVQEKPTKIYHARRNIGSAPITEQIPSNMLKSSSGGGSDVEFQPISPPKKSIQSSLRHQIQLDKLSRFGQESKLTYLDSNSKQKTARMLPTETISRQDKEAHDQIDIDDEIENQISSQLRRSSDRSAKQVELHPQPIEMTITILSPLELDPLRQKETGRRPISKLSRPMTAALKPGLRRTFKPSTLGTVSEQTELILEAIEGLQRPTPLSDLSREQIRPPRFNGLPHRPTVLQQKVWENRLPLEHLDYVTKHLRNGSYKTDTVEGHKNKQHRASLRPLVVSGRLLHTRSLSQCDLSNDTNCSWDCSHTGHRQHSEGMAQFLLKNRSTEPSKRRFDSKSSFLLSGNTEKQTTSNNAVWGSEVKSSPFRTRYTLSKRQVG